MESEEQEPNLFQQPPKRDFTVLRQIITWTIVLGLVGGLGFYCYRSSVQQSAIDAEKDREKKEKEDLKKQEADHRAQIAIKTFHDFVAVEFPGWKLEGDNLSDFDLSDDLESILSPHEPIFFFVQLSKNGKTWVVRLALVNLKKQDGTQYWAAYRPTTISLGNIELQDIRSKEFKSGQENPPDPYY